MKIEGDFFLRYRIFDLFSRTAHLSDLPVQAECCGGPFHIYSTKEFPGLQPSTELSKVTWNPSKAYFDLQSAAFLATLQIWCATQYP